MVRGYGVPVLKINTVVLCNDDYAIHVEIDKFYIKGTVYT